MANSFSVRPPLPRCSGGRQPQWRQPELPRKRPLQAVYRPGEGDHRAKRKKELPTVEVRDFMPGLTTEFVYVYQSLPLVMSVLEKEKFFLPAQLSMTHALQSKGIQSIATEIAHMQLPLAGRLSSFISNWEAITQDQWVLQSVHGYRIEFLQKPRQNHRPPQITFAKKEEECMQEEIQSMLDKQAITDIESCPEGFYSQMFLVPKKDGRQRPVINLKRLNQSVKTEHFKMEGIHMLKDLLKAGDWMAKIDLKDAYFMIPMAQEDREFLRFQWKDKAYQFNCLPFGLSSAPWVFTKTTRPVVATLRELGLRLIIYIDDILIVAETESLLRNHITACLCQHPPDQVPWGVGICSELCPVHCKSIRGHGHRIRSPAGIDWQLMCQPAGKQVHLQRSQPLVYPVEYCWA